MKPMIILLLFALAGNIAPKLDFGSNKGGEDWMIINDGVMGGLSQSEANFTQNSILFKGVVSLENNGGFASLRSPYQAMDFSKFTQVKIRLRSKGQIIAFTMNTHRVWYYPYFKKDIITSSEDWEEVTIPLKDFDQYRIGDKTGKKLDEENLSKIIRIGFITNEKKAGPFEAEIDYIMFE